MGRKAFMFYEEWATTLSSLPPEMRHELMDALVEYFITGEEPTFANAALGGLFFLFKCRMDADGQIYDEKCEKNRANASKRKKSKANANEEEQSQANANERKRTLTNANERKRTQVTKLNITKLNDDVNIILARHACAHEAIQRQFKLSPEEIERYGEIFNDHCRAGANNHTSEEDALQHFRDWLRIRIKEERKQNGNKGNNTNNSCSYADRAGAAVELVNRYISESDEDLRQQGRLPPNV